MIDKFDILLTLNLGGYTYEKAVHWATDRGKMVRHSRYVIFQMAEVLDYVF
jgi:hypothetical protein